MAIILSLYLFYFKPKSINHRLLSIFPEKSTTNFAKKYFTVSLIHLINTFASLND